MNDTTPIPADCDARKIMINIIPGPDGEGVEIYAKNAAEIEELLAKLGEKIDDLEQKVKAQKDTPIPMLLHCPACHYKHVDAPETEKGWLNPPHRKHLCHMCGLIWQPALVQTTGVAELPQKI